MYHEFRLNIGKDVNFYAIFDYVKLFGVARSVPEIGSSLEPTHQSPVQIVHILDTQGSWFPSLSYSAIKISVTTTATWRGKNNTTFPVCFA